MVTTKFPRFWVCLALACGGLGARPADAELRVVAADRFFAGRGGALVFAGELPGLAVESIEPLVHRPADPPWGPQVFELVMRVRGDLVGSERILQRVEIPPLPEGQAQLRVVARGVGGGSYWQEVLVARVDVEPALSIEPSAAVLSENETFRLHSRFRAVWGSSPGGFELKGGRIRAVVEVGCFVLCPFAPPIRDFDLESPPLGPFPPGEYLLEVRNTPANGSMVLHRQKIVVVPEEALVQGGRFGISIALDPPHAGLARLARLPSADSALFYFFAADNWEALVKVLDGCAINGRIWVYAALSTDLGYTLSVHDRESGVTREYRHPAGSPAPAITDADAFACATGGLQ